MKPTKNFNEKCYELLKKVPSGKVTTYKAIAMALNTKDYRVVAMAMKLNKNSKIPCHRVVNSNGELGGFNQGLVKKIELLKKEGVEIKNNKIDLERFGLVFS